MEKTIDIVAIGECLLELSAEGSFKDSDTYHMSLGGDVIVSAISAHKMGSKVGLISSIGDDSFKDIILDKLNSYGLDTSNVHACTEKNGLYVCSQTKKDDFVTYRRRIASGSLSIENLNFDYINSARAVYATGITQSVSGTANQLVKEIFKISREQDILTAYDPNHISSFMTVYDTQEYLDEIIENIDVLFISLKNESDAILGLTSPERIVNYFTSYGVKIVVIKSHVDHKYYVYSNGKMEHCDFCFDTPVLPVRGSGDVFNGGFLAALISGYTPIEALRMAAKQAGIYIQGQGGVNFIPSHEELLRK